MAEDVTIDKVQIEVEGKATKAVDALVKLENALKKVKSAMGGFNTNGIDDLQKKFDAVEQSAKRVSNTKVTPKVDTSNITKSEKQITNSFNNLQDKFTRLSALGNAALGGDKSAITSFKRQAVSMQAEIDVLQNKLQRLGNTRPKTTAFNNIEKQIETLNDKMRTLKEESKKPMAKDAYTNMQLEIQKVQNEIDKLSDKQRQMIKDGSAYKGTDPFQNIRDGLAELQNDFDTLKGKVNELNRTKPHFDFSKAIATAKPVLDVVSKIVVKVSQLGAAIATITAKGFGKAFGAIKDGFGRVASNIKNLNGFFDKGFGKIIKYGFGVRSLYVLFRRLRKAVTDSFVELQKSGAFFEETKENVTALKTALATLKFQFGAAFEPIFNTVAPALQSLINYLVTAANTISAFMAKITGKNTYSKVAAVTLAAEKNTAGAAKAAKDLNKQLQKFDELNNLTTNNSGSGGGGGGAASGDSAIYEEANVDDALGDFAKKIADGIKAGDWEGVGSLISAKLTEMMSKIPWDEIYAKADAFGTNLAKFLKGLITPELFEELGKTIANSLKTALIALKGFSDTLNEVGEDGQTGWQKFGASLAAGIKGFIDQNPLQLAADTFSSLASGILDGVLQAIIDLTKPVEGEEQSTIEKIAQQIADAIGSIPAKDLAFKVGNIVSGLATAIYQLVSNKETWKNLGTKLSDGINGFLEGMNEVDSDTGMNGWETLGADIKETITGFADSMITALDGVNWEEVGQGIADFIAHMDLTKIVWSLGDLASSIITALGQTITGFEQNASEKAKLETAIAGLLAVLAVTGNVPAALVLAATITGIKLGTELYEISSGNTVDQSFIEEIGDIIDGLFGENKVEINLFEAIDFVFEELTGQHDENASGWETALRSFVLNTVLVGAFGKWKAVYNLADAIDFVFNGTGISSILDDLSHELDLWWNGFEGDIPSESLEGMKSKLEKLGKNIIDGIKLGWGTAEEVKALWKDPVGYLWDAVVYWLKEKFGIDSPAKNMYIYGQYILEGIIAGFRTAVGFTSGNYSITSAVQFFKDTFTKALTWGTALIEKGKQIVGGIKDGIVEAAKDIGTWFETNVTSKIQSAWDKVKDLKVTFASKYDDIKDSVEAFQKKIAKGLKTTIQTKLKAPKTDNKKSVAKKIKKFISGDDSNAEFSKTVKLKIDVSSSINSLKDYVNDYIIAPLNKTLTELGKKAKIIITPIDRLAKGGALYGGGWHNIPQFASGTTDALKHGSIFAAGENGPEVVGHINGRTEILNRSQLASIMYTSITRGMAQFKNAQIATPQTLGFADNIASGVASGIAETSNNNNDLIAEQNRLIAEQNRILQQILHKPSGITSREVFDATRREAQNYNNRTGNLPFLF